METIPTLSCILICSHTGGGLNMINKQSAVDVPQMSVVIIGLESCLISLELLTRFSI